VSPDDNSSVEEVAVGLLASTACADASLVGGLAELVNRVYAVAEAGLWVEGATRTTASEMRDLIAQREVAVATIGQDVVGCVRIRELDGVRGEFGMLAVTPDRHGRGIGRALVRFAEQRSRERGHRTIELELLVPRGWVHPSKRLLDQWYRRIGYRVARSGTIEDAYPPLAPLLATPCHYVIYEKPLATMTGDLAVARAFTNPDASGRSKPLAAYLDTAAGVLAEHKRTSIEAMGLQPGDAGLDVGCGTGADVRLIAARAGASGRAVGVDVSSDLLAAARERTPAGVTAEFVAADAHALPFADAEFAAARVERTLQHVTDPAGVIAQMARVVRPGGRVVADEPDWDTVVISSGDQQTARAILDELRASSRNPAVGRAVAGYFADAGIAVNTVDAAAVVLRDATAARAFFLLDGAVARVGTDVARGWLHDLGEQSARGAFCAALTLFRIVGTIPDA
jgi:ubiquinone/menaquinone biosynthesis C-methylase UbiE/GNAT superfamily N-acetyltransferase